MTSPAEADRLYTRQFFVVFVAVGFFVTGMALQFHFGQYVEYLGYGVDTLGWVLSISMVGTLLVRLQIGRWIDRFGCRATWMAGAAMVALTVGSMQFATDLRLLVVLRALSTMSIACAMTTVPVIASLIAPPERRAEAIGTIGLAGFIGMVVGPALGDWIFSGTTESITPFRLFFSASAGCAVLGGLAMFRVELPAESLIAGSSDAKLRGKNGATGEEAHRSQISLIVAHWPGAILLVGAVFMMVFCVQNSFLERLAEDRGFKDIKVFFLFYGPSAIALRLIFRRLPQQFGRTRTVLLGLVLLGAGLACLVGVQSQMQLILPAVLMGAGHCFIFPSMVDLAAERLPPSRRGTGTSLILGAGDAGMLVGFVFLGELIDSYGFDTSLAIMSGIVAVVSIFFAVARRRDILRSSGLNQTANPCPES